MKDTLGIFQIGECIDCEEFDEEKQWCCIHKCKEKNCGEICTKFIDGRIYNNEEHEMFYHELDD